MSWLRGGGAESDIRRFFDRFTPIRSRPRLRARPGSDYFMKEKSVSFVTTQQEQLEIFVSTLSAGGESYAATEAANAVAAG